ncbi:Hemolysin activation/secretion protein [Variovorax sp. OK605]|nr:Hemolysin activation/secretion protein [Variovorax sp. OK605]
MNPTSRALSSRLPPHALATLFALCLCAIDSHGQALPLPSYGIGDAVREAQQPPRPPAPARPPAPVIDAPQERPMNLPAGETLAVRAFRVEEGAELVPQAELQLALDPYQGRALSMAEIEQAAAKVSALYRAHGYLVARAYVPRQDASGGTLVIRVLVGTYGNFALKNRSLVRDSVLGDVFASVRGQRAAAVTPVAPVSRAELERAMLLVSDMPGATLPRLTVSPGEAQGTSDFDIDVGEAPRVGGYVAGDNHGSRYTGRNRLSAGLDINSPFGIADKLSFNLMGAQGGGLDNARLAYSLPLAANGLRVELAASRTSYHLGADYSDLEARGRAHTVEATFSYPLVRSREQNLSLSLNLAARQLRDEIGAVDSVSDRRVKVATFGAQHEAWGNVFGRAGYTNLSAGLTWGHLGIDDPAQRAVDCACANTLGSFARLNLRLAAGLELAKDWSANGTLSLQKALRNRNLDGSEQMGISGPGGVKAYREWVSGDNGYLFNLELRYALPAQEGLVHSLGVFADVGRAWQQNSNDAAGNGVRLSDVGVGYSARYRSMFARVQVARAAGARPQEFARDGRTRVLLQAGVLF